MGEHRIRTGRGRPHVPLRDHPFKIVLACIDLLDAEGMPRQKATLLMSSVFFATDAQPIAAADLPEKLRRAFEKHGGIAMAYTLPSSGNPRAENVKERMQAVDTLTKMSARYSTGADLKYRRALSRLIDLALFATGKEEDLRKTVDALLRQLDDPDPQIHQLAGLLLK